MNENNYVYLSVQLRDLAAWYARHSNEFPPSMAYSLQDGGVIISVQPAELEALHGALNADDNVIGFKQVRADLNGDAWVDVQPQDADIVSLRARALKRKGEHEWSEADDNARRLRTLLEKLFDVAVDVPHGARAAEVENIRFTLPPKGVAGVDAHVPCPHHKDGWINRNVNGLTTLGQAIAAADDCDGDCDTLRLVTYRGEDPSPAERLASALVDLLADQGWILQRDGEPR